MIQTLVATLMWALVASLLIFRRKRTDRSITYAALTIAISCVGRRLVLGARAEDELEAARDALTPGSALVGFYSYGELSPSGLLRCDLHNQTMTVTTFREA